MKKFLLTIIAVIIVAGAYPGMVIAGPDQYIGDTAIYGGSPVVLQPNVLIILDDSGSMGDTVPGGSYDPNTTYPVTNHCTDSSGHSNTACSTIAVYKSSWTFLNASVNNINTSCNGANPKSLLQTTGTYNGRKLNSSGTCASSGSGSYAIGNWVNWSYGDGLPKTKISVARDVVTNLLNSTTGVKFGLMTYHYVSSTGQGAQFMSVSVSGSTYVTTVKDMDSIFTGATTNRQALVSAVSTLTDLNDTPLGESLVEALRYFQGAASDFGNTIGVSGGHYTSPVQWGCQKNYIIFVTDGMSTADDSSKLDFLNTTYGRYDGGGCSNPPYTTCASNRSHSMPGAAKYLYDHDLFPDATYPWMQGVQNVTTYAVGFGLGGADQEAIDLLQLTVDNNHGHGQYYLAGSEQQLHAALTSVLAEIFSVNTSFVAPVVPVSPENRVYSGSRVYMGFFKPDTSRFWSGNLKKFGLDDNNNILDAGGNYATYVDNDNNRIDDRDHATLPSTALNGSFRASSFSYWSTVADAGDVETGGVGEILHNRVTARNIYTYKGTNAALTDSSNAFTTANISPTDLGFVAGDTGHRDGLISFLKDGVDVYDENNNGNTTEKRSWILGDILHSKPQIVVYNTYQVATQETNCSFNKTVIFVGANDGMLHAFNDCDGSEAWAFIPPDLLSTLQYLGSTGSDHTYFVDLSPAVYLYNNRKDGIINSANGDKVILLLGLRRGGGLDAAPTKGYYYAIDVTNPMTPQFLWKKSSADAGFGQLGESWSEISIGKIKLGTTDTIAAFIDAGYDNCNEDGRFGSTQTFSGVCVAPPTGDNGVVTSSGVAAPVSPTGRGIYVIQIATLDGATGVPSLTGSGTLLWSYTNSTNNPTGILFPMASRLKLLDKNNDGYIDTLYAGDTGGNLWRFNIQDISTTNWTVNKIFSANPGYTNGAADNSNGRKMFFEPSVFVQQDGSVRLFYGTGDREHPLNTAVFDRLYGLIDRGQTTGMGISEANMLDVTTDTLQTGSVAQAQTALTALNNLTNYGWYVRLDQSVGEKVLAPALVFSGVVIYTTYSPSTVANTDPCQTGNLGTSRVYVVDYRSGEAVVNYDTTNDTTTPANTRSQAPGGGTLLRSDRSKTLGGGIPSGGVMVTSKTGKPTLMIGVGGSIATLNPVRAIVTMPLYWRQKVEFQ